MINIEQARILFKEAFPHTESCTKYIARYNNRSGKEIALERERLTSFFVWTEQYNESIEGVIVKNTKYPMMPYERNQARNSNLNQKNTPHLMVGNKVWYLEIADIEVLKKLLQWYSTI